MILHVESSRGLHGVREPVAFHLAGRRVAVIQILDRWLAEDRSYFKVETDDSATCILRYMHAEHEWELSLYDAAQAGRSDLSRH